MLDAWELPGPPKTVDIGTVCIPAGKILHREQPGEGKSMPTTPSTTPRVEASAESVLRAAGRILQREEPGPGEGKSMPNTPSTTPRLEASAEPVLRASGKILQKEQPAACKSMPTTPRVEHAAPVVHAEEHPLQEQEPTEPAASVSMPTTPRMEPRAEPAVHAGEQPVQLPTEPSVCLAEERAVAADTAEGENFEAGISLPAFQELPLPVLPTEAEVTVPVTSSDKSYLKGGLRKLFDLPPQPPLFLPPPEPPELVPPLPPDAMLSPQPTPEGSPRSEANSDASTRFHEAASPMGAPQVLGPSSSARGKRPRPIIPPLDFTKVIPMINEPDGGQAVFTNRMNASTGSESSVASEDLQERGSPTSAAHAAGHENATLLKRAAVSTTSVEIQAGRSYVHKLQRLSDLTYGQYVREQQKDSLVKATTWGGHVRSGQRRLCLAAAVLFQVAMFVFALDAAGVSSQSTKVDLGQEARTILGIASGAGGMVTLCYCLFQRGGLCHLPMNAQDDSDSDLEVGFGRNSPESPLMHGSRGVDRGVGQSGSAQFSAL